ncbi:hypothetical protein SRHO_G00225380 [Serrasalmus rhombeus]
MSEPSPPPTSSVGAAGAARDGLVARAAKHDGKEGGAGEMTDTLVDQYAPLRTSDFVSISVFEVCPRSEAARLQRVTASSASPATASVRALTSYPGLLFSGCTRFEVPACGTERACVRGRFHPPPLVLLPLVSPAHLPRAAALLIRAHCAADPMLIRTVSAASGPLRRGARKAPCARTHRRAQACGRTLLDAVGRRRTEPGERELIDQ